MSPMPTELGQPSRRVLAPSAIGSVDSSSAPSRPRPKAFRCSETAAEQGGLRLRRECLQLLLELGRDFLGLKPLGEHERAKGLGRTQRRVDCSKPRRRPLDFPGTDQVRDVLFEDTQLVEYVALLSGALLQHLDARDRVCDSAVQPLALGLDPDPVIALMELEPFAPQPVDLG